MTAQYDPWETTPRKLLGNASREVAEASGWRFETAERGYNGNPPAFYAIAPWGQRYIWNRNMRHGGSDPWEPTGETIPPAEKSHGS